MRNNSDRLRVVDAIHEGVGGESAEDDGVGSADASAGQHGDGEFGRHAHVDGDAVALPDAQRLQDIGELLNFFPKLLVGVGADFAGLTFPDEGGFVLAPGFDMAVEAVIGEVDFAAGKPFGPGAIPLQHTVPFLEPVQVLGDASPELFGLLYGFSVKVLVFFERLDVGFLAEVLGRFEFAVFVKNGINAGVGGKSCLVCHAGLVGRGLIQAAMPRRFYCGEGENVSLPCADRASAHPPALHQVRCWSAPAVR